MGVGARSTGTERHSHHDSGAPAHSFGGWDESFCPPRILGIKLFRGCCALGKWEIIIGTFLWSAYCVPDAYTHVYVCKYTYVWVCACMCVCIYLLICIFTVTLKGKHYYSHFTDEKSKILRSKNTFPKVMQEMEVNPRLFWLPNS